MATTPNKSSPKRSPVSPGFGKRVVNSMTSPFRKTVSNAFKAAFETVTPTKSQRAKNVNSGLSTFLTPTKK
jgi:hypothetical protein